MTRILETNTAKAKQCDIKYFNDLLIRQQCSFMGNVRWIELAIDEYSWFLLDICWCYCLLFFFYWLSYVVFDWILFVRSLPHFLFVVTSVTFFNIVVHDIFHMILNFIKKNFDLIILRIFDVIMAKFSKIFLKIRHPSMECQTIIIFVKQ